MRSSSATISDGSRVLPRESRNLLQCYSLRRAQATLSGESGKHGESGENGKYGKNGKNGNNGKYGNNGKNGENGESYCLRV